MTVEIKTWRATFLKRLSTICLMLAMFFNPFGFDALFRFYRDARFFRGTRRPEFDHEGFGGVEGKCCEERKQEEAGACHGGGNCVES